MNEQLSAGEQNREHYESRLLSIAEELSKKEEAKKEQQEEGELLKEKTSEMKKKMKKQEEALSKCSGKYTGMQRGCGRWKKRDH